MLSYSSWVGDVGRAAKRRRGARGVRQGQRTRSEEAIVARQAGASWVAHEFDVGSHLLDLLDLDHDELVDLRVDI